MEKKLADVYSAVFGYSMCDVSDCSLLLSANRLPRTVLYVSDVARIDLTRQVLMNALNDRSKEENPVKVSASDSTVNQTKTIQISQSKSEKTRRSSFQPSDYASRQNYQTIRSFLPWSRALQKAEKKFQLKKYEISWTISV